MGQHWSPQYGHVILVRIYPVLTAGNLLTATRMLQAPTLARKCDISPWFAYGADGADRWMYSHVTTKISQMVR